MASGESSKNKFKAQSKFGKFKLLLWKNLLLRKRSWLLTILEIFIPVLFMALIVSLRTLADSNFLSEIIEEDSHFGEADEHLLREIFCNRSLGLLIGNKCHMIDNTLLPGDKKLFWGPPNKFTTEMMAIFNDDIVFSDSMMVTVNSSEEIDNLVDSSYYETNDTKVAFYIGIFFNLEDPLDNNPPKNLNYDLRLQRFWFTDFIYPFVQVNGPRNNSVIDNTASYTMDGFVLLQTLIDRAYITILENTTKRHQNLKNFSLFTQMYPYPAYTSDHGLSQLYGSSLPTFIVFSLILLSPTLIKSIVYEKETGVRELVRMMGMESWLIWVGWFIYSFFPLLIVSIIISVILTSSFGNLPPIFAYSDPSLLWFILMLYCMTAVFFCFAISCFFSKPTLATTIGVLAWILSYFIPRSFLDNNYADMGLTPKLLSSLLPNMALTWILKIIGMFEGRGLGITWDNLGDTGNPRDQLTPGLIIMMLIIDCILFLLITWYVDAIKPGTYGVPERWNFPFIKSYWKCGSERADEEHLLDGNDISDDVYNKYFETEPRGMKVGIQTKGLRKEFRTSRKKVKVAVDHVNLTCYEGQCTVLLGHNGAGKTTTMSVLTGVYPPTGGNASINGWNIKTHLREARAQVGLCPQHNTLFNSLTVQEHLLFFARLKGSSSSLAKEQSDELLKKLQLEEKKNQFGSQLSGGMKRKLCLAIALIAGSRVVILDEPSSGLDPESRRWVWDIVQQERNHRTVLVTTHHMEEADVLGDRIAIMSEGKVVCCGSSLFLKNTFGDGYTLSATTGRGSEEQPIAEIISDHITDCSLRSKENTTLNFKIAPETNKFSDLLDHLTREKKSLGIVHLGLSLTTMEQVFLRVGKMLEDQKVSAATENSENSTASNGDVNQRNSNISRNSLENGKIELERQDSYKMRQYREQKMQGMNLTFNRVRALLKKKYIYSKRKWLLLIFQALIPVMVTLLCLFIDAAFSPEEYIEPPIELNLDMFTHSYSYVKHNDNDRTSAFADEYSKLFYDPYHVSRSFDLEGDLIDASYENINQYRENYVTSAEFRILDADRTGTLMMYQSIPYHAPGIGVNLIDNAILHYLGYNNTITTRNSPLPRNHAISKDDDTSITYSALIYSTIMPIALAFLTSSYIVFPLNERVSNAKQIQEMTGTSTLLLWLTSYMWDLVSYMASALLIFICFMLFDTRGYFTADGAPGVLFLVLFLYGISSIPMAYVFSMLYQNAASGFAVLTLINIIAGMIISVATTLMVLADSATTDTISAVVGNITSFVPAYTASQSFLSIVDVSYYNNFCDTIDASVKDSLCAVLEAVPDSPFVPCCPNVCNGTLYGCFEKKSYLDWSYPSMGMFVLYFFVDAVLYILLLTYLESPLSDIIANAKYAFMSKFRKEKKISMEKYEMDDDVKKEQEEAYLLMAETEIPHTAIVVKDLTKIFTNNGLTAVNKISFHFPKGECFGLLGVNGAGKTTTFRMLTGDEIRTMGDARINNNFLSHGRKQFMEEIGYCPQFDAIIGELTGEEMLSLMAGLRGVPRHMMKKLIDRLVSLVDLTECCKRPCSTYSGGNKRKLSTAMALVGQPPLVFLDEPTSGVDPVSRRKVWEAIRDANSNGQSVILTSHSMDECEALCSKVVIMTKGTLRCAGTTQHLKAKFGQGYTIQVKIKSALEEETEQEYLRIVSDLKKYIHSEFLGSKLADEHRGMLVYRVPSSHSWSSLFSKLENLKQGTQFGHLIEDYAAMDPSLEQVFLSFAREGISESKNAFDNNIDTSAL